MTAVRFGGRCRPAIDCQFIGAAYDEGPPERHWTDRIVVEENLLQAWLIVAERYMRHAERSFSIDMPTLRRSDDPPGYAAFREALVNQLIHQDYGDRGRTAFIRFYRDRTVFRAPTGGQSAAMTPLLPKTGYPTGGLSRRASDHADQVEPTWVVTMYRCGRAHGARAA